MTNPEALAPDARIFVAGHRGLVGSAMCRAFAAAGYTQLLTRSSAELDLRDRRAVDAFMFEHRPDAVVLCAARVGGIKANSTLPVPFLADNLYIQNNVILAAHEVGAPHLLFLGSSCIFPRECPQPMSEAALLTGPLEATNRPYAVAKIAGIELCWAVNRQYGRRYLALMPTNLYGPGDNYDLQGSHVLPALIRRMHEARESKAPAVRLWGSGRPLREFLHSDDLAAAALHLLRLAPGRLDPLFTDSAPPLLNVGFGEEIPIAGLADKIAATVGYGGHIEWDTSQPDGTPRKLLDSRRMHALGWRPSISLDAGLRAAYRDFLGGQARS